MFNTFGLAVYKFTHLANWAGSRLA